MNVVDFINQIQIIAGEFYTGVPDSQLQPLCNYLMNKYNISNNHIITANEGNSTALAAGYYLATGKTPIVYMQNSGLGNIINPVVSLMNDKVYGIPCIFIIGWRGEPGEKDEPQHIYQGEITLKLLEDIGINAMIISKETTLEDLNSQMDEFKTLLDSGRSVAFVIRKDALYYDEKTEYRNPYTILREEIIKHITTISDEDIIISTTGKASRELFEIREQNEQSHKYDFLTVGSMGHSSSIALGVALNRQKNKVWCIDGDGAILMHMGSMAVIGSMSPQNMIHIVINNNAHETVGGMPTVAGKIDLKQIAIGCGYKYVISINDFNELDKELQYVKHLNELSFIEINASMGSRKNLGRPTTTARENKEKFMEYLKELMK